MGLGDCLGHAFQGEGTVVLGGFRVGESFRRLNHVPGMDDP